MPKSVKLTLNWRQEAIGRQKNVGLDLDYTVTKVSRHSLSSKVRLFSAIVCKSCMGCESTGRKLGICYSSVVDVFLDDVGEKGRRLVEDVLRSTEC
mmetsp:Transcript_86785/g.136923  ORF Transcript_86785/g.136923 Transcript_86785/m.136923 type:complete len:96 (+) Transcript_86785:147-434(+)